MYTLPNGQEGCLCSVEQRRKIKKAEGGGRLLRLDRSEGRDTEVKIKGLKEYITGISERRSSRGIDG